MCMRKKFLTWVMYRLRRFAGAEKGAVAPLVGVGALMLIAATGVAIDTARAQLVQARLTNSLDAAGLAAGATVSTSNINSEVTKYLNANFSSYLGSNITNSTVTPNSDNTVISLTASANVPTLFMKIFGITSTSVGATSEITRTNKGLELVLVLDNTGSMAGSKLSGLKTAATDLVTILHGNSTPDDLWIGIVPFSQAVNIGPSRDSWTVAGSQNWGPASWVGGVEARETSNRDVTDDPPAVALFPKYYGPCISYFASWSNSWYGNNTSGSNPKYSNCSTSSGWKYRSPLSSALGPNQYVPQEVTPMTSDKNTLINNINVMEAVGDTATNLGMVWGWRMLSPRWRTLWGGEMNTNNLPLDYNTPLMNKVVVLLSDGDNSFVPNNYTAYGFLSNGRLGTTNQSTAVATLNTRTTQVCNSMKNNNITVYTVALGTSISAAGKTLLKNCASQSDYYFESPDTATLQTAFHQIGDALASLRVSK